MSFVVSFGIGRLSRIGLLPLFILVSACGGKGPEEELRILGTPPEQAYLGVEYKYDFGIDGGDGIPTVSLTNAPRWLSAEYVDNTARKGVVIRGVPGVSGGGAGLADVNDGADVTLNIYDGGNMVSTSFPIRVTENTLSVSSAEVTEGQADKVPSNADDEPLSKCIVEPVNGQKTDTAVYVPISLDWPAVHTVVARFTTKESTSNSSATPDVDYLHHSGVVRFEPGETLCFVKVYVQDDNIAEDTEQFQLVLEEVEQGLATVGRSSGGAYAIISIKDNEPLVSWAVRDVVVTEGGSVEVMAKLDRPAEGAVFANFKTFFAESGRSEDTTTATRDDYCLYLDKESEVCAEPDSSGVYKLEFAEGQTEKVVVIRALNNVDGESAAADEQILLAWERSEHIRETKEVLRVYINEWKTPLTLGLEPGVRVRELLQDSHSNIYVAFSGTQPGKPRGVQVYRRDGNPEPLHEVVFVEGLGDEYLRELTDAYLWEYPVNVGQDQRALYRDLYMVGVVDGNVDGQSSGGKDVVVELWRQINHGQFGHEWTRQYGSSFDDVAHAIYMDGGNMVYVVGETKGRFDGGAALAGQDAFIIKYDSDGEFVFAENLSGIGSREAFLDVIGSGTTQIIATGFVEGNFAGEHRGAKDIIVGAYSREGSVQRARQDGNVEDNVASTIALLGRNILIGGYTRGSLLDEADQSNGGEDAFISFYSNASTLEDTVQFGSAGDDRVLDIATDGDSVFATGFTEGPLFPGCSYSGGKDAFLVRFDWNSEEDVLKKVGSGCSPEDEEGWPIQRGTQGNDIGSQVVVTPSKKLMWLTETETAEGNRVEIRPYNLSGQSLLLNEAP